MSQTSKRAGVMFLGPGPGAQGGISAVISNYQKTSFWTEFNCSHFPTTTDINSLPKSFFYDLYRVCRFVGVLISHRRPRVASIHTSHKGSFYRKLVYLLLSRAFRVPVVLHIHPAAFSDFYREGGSLRKLLIRKAARLSERVVFLSERTKSDFIHILPSEKLEAIPNPVEIPETSQATVTRERGRPRILFLGWIVRQKGVYDLVDAIPEVLQHFPEAVFTFAGNKEVERLRNLLVERGLSGASEVLGWVTGEAKVDLLQASDVLVLPSYTEGMPNVILEAMANKIPIVTTPVGDIPSVLTNGQTALFIEAGNPQSIANGIKTLLSDPVRAAAIAEAAYACACRNHSFEIVGAQLAEVYKPVCARTGFRSFQKGRP